MSDPRELEQKKTYLDLLAIGHYINGGLMALVMMFMILAVSVMGFVPLIQGGAEGAVASFFMVAAFGLLITFGAAYAVLNLVTARSLQTRRRYTLCMVTSLVNCLNAPLGTVLGVLTIVVLAGLDVKEMFGAAPPPPATGVPVAPPAGA